MMDVAELGIKHLCEDTLGYKVESGRRILRLELADI